MNDTQMQAMSLERHHRILARVRAAETPNAPGEAFAVPGPLAADVPAAAEVSPPREPVRTLTTSQAAQTPPAPLPAAMPQLSADQAALLAASLGTTLPPETAPAPTAPAAPSQDAAPEMSEDQMSTLMAAFGQQDPAIDTAVPQAAAAMAATAIPQSRDDNLRYFPINQAAQPAQTTANMTASDTYLRAMQQMERNLGAYGGLARRGN